MTVDANGLEEALSVIFQTWEKEAATIRLEKALQFR